MTKTGSLDVQAMDIFTAALDQPSDTRLDWAIAQCGADKALTAKVRALIIADGSGEDGLRTGGAGQDASDDPIPDRAGAYKITDLIGRGGMGAVYRGTRDTGDFEHSAAIKIVKPGVLSEALIARFERERQILASFNHPNIARLLDGGTLDDGSPYIVMELIDGEPISDWAKTQNLSREDRLWLFNDACAAVRYAHQNLIVHRDITPSNVLVTTRGAVKLIDFGIAKSQDASIFPPDAASSPPSVASLSFTPGFAAPERARGAPSNILSDVYSLGKLLEDILDPNTINADLKAMIERATAADPASRYKSVDALMDDLQNLREGRPLSARNNSISYTFGKFIKRRRAILAGVSAAIIGLITALGVTLFQYNRAESALVQANARFEDARGLSRSLIFDVYDSVDDVAGTLEPRKELADLIRIYTDKLASDPYAPTDILLDIGILKLRLSDIYGGVGIANLGDTETSFQLLLEAEIALESVLDRTPDNGQALAELMMTKRMLGMQHLNYKLDIDAAAAKNAEVLARADTRAHDGAEYERTLLRHLWSARSDRLRIMTQRGETEAAISSVQEWRKQLDEAMFERLGGGEEMAAYMAVQEAELLIAGDRPSEAITPLAYAIDYRETKLDQTPDSYYQLTQLMTANAELSLAHRKAGDGSASLYAADRAVELARNIAAQDETDAGGPEGLANMLQLKARAHVMTNTPLQANAAADEAIQLAQSLTQQYPNDAFYLKGLFFSLLTKAEINADLEEDKTACLYAKEALAVRTQVDAIDGADMTIDPPVLARLETLAAPTRCTN